MYLVNDTTTQACPTLAAPAVRVRRLGIDTHQEPIIYMRRDCPVCRSEGFEAQSRINITVGERTIIATLNVVEPALFPDELLSLDEAGLSEAAWKLLEPREGAHAELSHPRPLESLSHIRAKIYGKTLSAEQMHAIMRDMVHGRFADVHLAGFLAACAGDRMTNGEIVALTQSMVDVGEQLSWNADVVVDKHCVGGLPGNRTTPLVVSIVAAYGLTIPKTSSRAITSPAGTADAMATLTDVDLDIADIRRVVQREGGCIAWGGAMRLSPVDDILIRVERALDIDSEGQLVASVLSKKIAAGSTHVIIDMPVGPTAKVRSPIAAQKLARMFEAVAEPMGLNLKVVTTDGSQPIGHGIGPALEARDVLAVLQGQPDAPADLHGRAVKLAAEIFELSGKVAEGQGAELARQILDDGRAWAKFQAICEAQGGLHEPPVAAHQHDVVAERAGTVVAVDNRRLARAAKLAGAPEDPAAGLEFHARLGTRVAKGEPLFTLHAESPGELDYALAYVAEHDGIITLE
ncbi:thymidine phosphorylase family protein [Persicimonas caeni]|uniref:Thymidine phosphorylase family protein n=1 Tax=Persicimonas caeni TaxID=2292766 RepID=A0A4Y6Q2Q6_PERCE|nr:thymidine phosphorylase family protein [Persicimonas caeni]QED36058.1 thymidine phosphorylase family protein [Persicimonas caeni]